MKISSCVFTGALPDVFGGVGAAGWPSSTASSSSLAATADDAFCCHSQGYYSRLPRALQRAADQFLG